MNIVRFKDRHCCLGNLPDTEYLYNYLVWALARHIDFSLDKYRLSNETFQVDYWTLYLLYDELCSVLGLSNKMSFICTDSSTLRYISTKLDLGDLYIFYLEYLDTDDKFSDIALSIIKLSK